MSSFHPYRSGTSLLIVLGMMTALAAPILTANSASAQLFPSRRNVPQRSSSDRPSVFREPAQVTIPRGTSIPVAYRDAKKIVIAPNETLPLTVNVAANIRDRRGNLLIPAGSQVIGQLQPVNGGSQFVAKEIVFPDNQRQTLDASSNVITKTEEVKSGGDLNSILNGALIGSAAAAILAAITGDRAIATEEVLGGAGLGALGGWIFGNQKAEVIVINPNTDLNLTLRSNLEVALR